MGALGAIVLAIIVRLVAGSTMAVHVSQPNAEMYHYQDMKRGAFEYGYQVQTENDQFQHKVKGPGDVTYGCYGFVDPSKRKHLVYYVSDRKGYRIILPNRPTKIYPVRDADSLNKLDGSAKGKDYEEKVVEWHNLFLPEPCFRLDEILDTAATNQATPNTVVPGSPVPSGPVQTSPELPRPTQYTIPTTARSRLVATTVPSLQVEDYDDDTQRPLEGGGFVVVNREQQPQQQQHGLNQQRGGGGQQQPLQPSQPSQPQPWQGGSLPDINPADINLDQFNAVVDPIYTGAPPSGGGGAQISFTQHHLNVTQLLAQIEAVNAQVITMNVLLAGMANNPIAFGNANENSCRSVVQLLQTQKRTPQLVYIPILIPYTEGQYTINQPIVPAQQTGYRKV